MANNESLVSPAKLEKNSTTGLIIGLVISTILAVGAGSGIALQLGTLVSAPSSPRKEGKSKPETVTQNYTGKHTVRTLHPIVTNFAAPQNTWVRLEAAIIFNDEDDGSFEVVTTQIAQDTLAYLRTLNLMDVEGASGLAYLRDDLTERAITRSEGKVSEFVIVSLVVE